MAATTIPPSNLEESFEFSLHSRSGVQRHRWNSASFSTNPITENGKFEGGVSRVLYSRDGSMIAVVQVSSVVVRSTLDGSLVCDIPRSKVSKIAFSPLNTFLTTIEPMDHNNKSTPNINIWKLRSPQQQSPIQPVASFNKKAPSNGDSKQLLPFWSSDELYCARLVYDGVDILLGSDPSQPILKHLPHDHAINLSWCPVLSSFTPKQHLIATFAPPRGTNHPGAVSIWNVDTIPSPNPSGTTTTAAAAAINPTSSKSCFQADNCELEWNPASFMNGYPLLLAHITTDSDPTGKSYYGQSALFVLHPTKTDLNTIVTFQKEGSIHSIAWNPQGNSFSVVYGHMPSMLTVYEVQQSGNFIPKADLGPASRNVVIYSPDGNSLCVGGFGNLQGEMDFFDCKTFTRLGKAQAHTSTSWTWSPDGRYFACAICAPRRRVDNGFKIFSINGEQLYQENISELYEFVWRPDLVVTEKTRKNPKPISVLIQKSGSPSSTPSSATTTNNNNNNNQNSPSQPQATTPQQQPALTGKYIPPGARGIPGANSSIVVHEESTDHVTVYKRNGQVARTDVNDFGRGGYRGGRGGYRGAGAGAGANQQPREEDLPPGWTPEKPKKNKHKKQQNQV